MKTEEGKSMEKAAEIASIDYVKKQDPHDKTDITKHDFFQGFIAGWQEAQQEGWIDVNVGEPEFSVQYLVYDPSAVIKQYTAFFLPYSTTEKAGFFHTGGVPQFEVTHYKPLPAPPLSKT